jgi:hypothetical protein
MAYSTGTASDIDDLINVKLKAFAIANGWTVNEDNWPTFISLSKGTCFVNFQRYLASGTDPFGYPYTDHRLYARISSGYGPGGFTGQPNVAAYDAIANDLTGPFTSYHFFSGPTVGPQYIHAVIETRAGFYVHIFFGEADTLTLGITPRPAYLAVSYYHWWAYSANPSARYEGKAGIGVHAFLFASSNTDNFQLYIGGADSQEPVKVGTQVLQICRPFNTLGDYITSSGAGHFADAVHSLGLNPINGVTPFLPAPLLVEFPSNVEAFFPLGVVPDFRFCSLHGRQAGEEVQLSGDTWKFFPMRRRREDGGTVPPEEIRESPPYENTSGWCGFAVRKIV